eukprot:m.97780 g.97780  ORF g.97780 m.97780 type:complete len:496 (+) comp27009_c0_seq1:67-1554(+)
MNILAPTSKNPTNMASVRRSLKNVTKNYAPCERDVRDATSNDNALAPAATMARITNATYDVTESPLAMAMVWKRLNDTGKNWRHVFKGLVLLDYLLKTGAEHVIQEVKQNKFALQCLLEFVYVDSRGVDKGTNVRQEAQKLLNLIENDAELREHRKRCLQEHQRLSTAMGRKAVPKRSQNSRVNKFNKKANVMPNGEIAPNLAEQNMQAIRNAQIQSYQEYATSPAGQQAVVHQQLEYAREQERRLSAQSSPNSTSQTPSADANFTPQNMTEEEALAYALKISALESGSNSQPQSPTVTYQPSSTPSSQRSSTSQPVQSQQPSDNDMSQEEAEQLAIALSLSLAESQSKFRDVLDSDNESDADEDTPPSTPYGGEFFSPSPRPDDFNESAALDQSELLPNDLPSYEASLLETSTLPQSNSPHEDHVGLMESYLMQDQSLGADDHINNGAASTFISNDNNNDDAYEDPVAQPGYMEVLPPNMISGRSSVTDDDDEL